MNAPAPTDFNQPEILDRLAQETLERAADRRIEACEVALSAGEGLAVTVREGECETLEFERDKSLAVTVYKEGCKGSATTSDFSAKALVETIDAAARIAAHGEPDEFAGLAEPQYLAKQVPDLNLDHPWALEAPEAIAIAQQCEAAALNDDPRIQQSDGASVNRYQGTRAYANSNGFHGAYRGTRHSISAILIGADKHGAMQRGYWYTSGRNPGGLEDAEAVGRRAYERTVAKIGAKKITTGEMPVMFEPRIAAGLVGHLIGAISGSAQYRRASFLLDALGEQVLPQWLSLSEHPHLPGAIGSAAFDGDGIATSKKTIVENGILKTYLLSAYAARRLGRAPTGNTGGTHNLQLNSGERSAEAMIKDLPEGLLVTDLMGFGVNGVTGDYSRGASGFLIRNGEIAHPVEEITIASNVKDMLLGITEVGNDIDTSMNTRTGSILIQQMAIAGSS